MNDLIIFVILMADSPIIYMLAWIPVLALGWWLDKPLRERKRLNPDVVTNKRKAKGKMI